MQEAAMKALHVVRAASAFVKLATDLSNLDDVFQLADGVSARQHLDAIRQRVARDEAGAAALRLRPRLHLDLAALRTLPLGTLGRAFAEHMAANHLDPAAIPTLPGSDELDFVRAHLYETHDVWHVVTGFATDVPGELGLQAFYFAQLPGKLPSAILAAAFLNTLLRHFEEREARMQEIVRGYLLGRRARPLFGVRWDQLWSTPLDEVRARLRLDRAAVADVMGEAAAAA
jgi:ubiquinone biosynthesis protein Coq4